MATRQCPTHVVIQSSKEKTSLTSRSSSAEAKDWNRVQRTVRIERPETKPGFKGLGEAQNRPNSLGLAWMKGPRKPPCPSCLNSKRFLQNLKRPCGVVARLPEFPVCPSAYSLPSYESPTRQYSASCRRVEAVTLADWSQSRISHRVWEWQGLRGKGDDRERGGEKSLNLGTVD